MVKGLIRKILIANLLIAVSIPALAIKDAPQNVVTDLSAEIASINTQILEAYQMQQESSNLQNIQTGASTLPSNVTPEGKSTGSQWQQTSANKNQHLQNNYNDQTQEIYGAIIKKMWSLKKKYEKNPFIRITGFGINVGIPPSVTISVEFK